MAQQIVTANRLQDGEVVYLCDDGRWSESLQDAAISDDEEGQSSLLAEGERAERDLKVVGPYLMPIEKKDDRLLPLSQREIIRAAGPTNRKDLGKQSL
ncbi:MAG: DUF2849 domain-containing protein [Kiloniellales bacterium]|nr:DUF2849 domain-containing protein [Kiloniellales bacterium]